MSKMTIAHLGVIVFAICLSTQVVSQGNSNSNNNNNNGESNNTDTGGGNSTSNSNATMVTTVIPISPTAAAVTPLAGAFSLLIPAFLAASLLHSYC